MLRYSQGFCALDPCMNCRFEISKLEWKGGYSTRVASQIVATTSMIERTRITKSSFSSRPTRLSPRVWQPGGQRLLLVGAVPEFIVPTIIRYRYYSLLDCKDVCRGIGVTRLHLRVL